MYCKTTFNENISFLNVHINFTNKRTLAFTARGRSVFLLQNKLVVLQTLNQQLQMAASIKELMN